jgi:acyl carrier protein
MKAHDVREMTAEVLATIAPETDLATVGEDEDLREALDLDSMDFLNFMIALSARSGTKIPDSDAPRLRTLGGLVAYFAGEEPPGRRASG